MIERNKNTISKLGVPEKQVNELKLSQQCSKKYRVKRKRKLDALDKQQGRR